MADRPPKATCRQPARPLGDSRLKRLARELPTDSPSPRDFQPKRGRPFLGPLTAEECQQLMAHRLAEIGISMRGFASLAGVSPKAVRNWVNDGGLDTFAKVLGAFNLLGYELARRGDFDPQSIPPKTE